MLYKKIDSSLIEQGYEKLPGTAFVTTYVQTWSTGEVKIVHFYKSVEGFTIPQDKIVQGVEQSERNFLIKGYRIKEIMNIIETDGDYAVDELEQGGINYWIVDNLRRRLMVYENQPDDFLGLRKIIEDELEREEKAPPFIERVSGFFRENSFVTFLIMGINLIVFLICNSLKTGEIRADVITEFGISYEDVLGKREYYRIITGMFLHADYRHIINNMFLLVCAGSQVEKWLGHMKYLLIYIAGGVGAGVCSVVYHMQAGMPVLSIGASGAIFGVFAATLIMSFFVSKVDTRRLLLIGLLALAASSGESVDTAAHVGGFVIGFITTLAFRVRVVFVRHSK